MEEPISNASILLYRAREQEGLAAAVTAPAKETFDLQHRSRTESLEAQTDERTDGFLAEAETDEDGGFTVTLDGERDEYDGGPIVIDAMIPDPLGRPDVEPVRTSITTDQPSWKETEAGLVADWRHCFTETQWCALLEELDCRVVCGQVTVCDSGEDVPERSAAGVPVPDLTVTAYDADIIQTDDLGSDVTDAGGWYSIYYTRSDFEEVPAPFNPIELRAGADLFFEIASPGGSLLVDEGPREGRQPGREDAGTCARVDLCVDYTPEPDPDQPTAWTRVGSAFDVDGDFDDDGYAESMKWALTGSLRMTGSTPRTTGSGNEVEYRFLVSRSTAPNSDPPLAASQFVDAVGDQNNPNLLDESVEVGMLVRFTPSGLESYSVKATRDDMDANGWFNIDDAVERTLTQKGVPQSDRGSFQWLDTDGLMGIDTRHLTTESDVPASAAKPGEDLDSAEEIDVERFAFRFEAREVHPDGSTSKLPAHGQTLNRAVVNNNATFRELLLVQHDVDGDGVAEEGCSTLSMSNVDLAYTVHHPHLRDAEIQIKPNDGGWTDLTDPGGPGAVDSELSFYSSTRSGTDLRSMQPTHYNESFDIASEVTKRCSYIVELRTRRRLHDGDSAANWSRLTPISFFAE